MVSDAIPPVTNGVSTLVVTVANKLTRMGHEVHVVCADNKANDTFNPFEKAKLIRYTSIPAIFYPKFRLAIPNPIKTHELLKQIEPDIIHSFSPSPLAVDFLIVARALQIKTVSTYTTQLNNKQYLQLAIKSNQVEHLEGLMDIYFSWFYNKCDKVLSEAKSMIPDMVEAGIEKQKIVVSPSPTDLSEIKIASQEEKPTVLAKYGLTKLDGVYLGRLSTEKNLYTLLDIWKIVLDSKPEVILGIIGEGKELDGLKKHAEKLNIQQNVKFVGSTSHMELMQSGLLSCAKVFVSASTSETLGLAAIEGMASKIPAVLFDATGVADSITDQGIVVEKDNKQKFAQAVLDLLNNDQLRQTMGEKAKVFSEFYNEENAINRYLKIYSELSTQA